MKLSSCGNMPVSLDDYSIQHLEKKTKYIYWIQESNNFICGNTITQASYRITL